jgi:hypothetical protein
LETFEARLGLLSAYLGCLSAEDANDEGVKADEAWLSTLEAEHTKLSAAVQETLAGMSAESFADLQGHPLMEGAGYPLERMREAGMALVLEGVTSMEEMQRVFAAAARPQPAPLACGRDALARPAARRPPEPALPSCAA